MHFVSKVWSDVELLDAQQPIGQRAERFNAGRVELFAAGECQSSWFAGGGLHKSPGVAILAEAADYGAQLDIVLLGGQDHQSGTERSSDYRDSRADTASHEMGHRSTMTCRRDQLAPLASGDGVGSIHSDAVSGGGVGRNVLIQRGLRFLTCNW